jgi:hypothetical protein
MSDADVEAANEPTSEEQPFLEEWTEEAEARRAEGQYMGYYSKPAYLRSKQRQSVRGSSGR